MHDTIKGPAIIAGDACVDVTIHLENLMRESDNFRSEKLLPTLSGGGTSANTAIALSKLGVHTAFLGTVGEDYCGRFIRKELMQNNVDTSHTLVSKSNTVSVFAFIPADGERVLWGFPREDCAYAQLNLDQIDLDWIKQAGWLHASGMAYMMDGSVRETIPKLFQLAWENGIPTSFDLNTRIGRIEDLDPGIRKAVENTLPYVRYLLGSAKDEFYAFWPQEDWKDSVRHFAKDGRVAISRMGSEGCFWVDEQKEGMCSAFDVPALNTTGAGDTFNAGFIAGMLQGCSVEEAVLWGSGAAGYKVARSGAHNTPNLEQLMTFMKDTTRR